MTNVETNSVKWWNSVKTNPALINNWLVKQFRGEKLAAIRVLQFAATFDEDDADRATVLEIARQEARHAGWILELLRSRGVEPDGSDGRARYWKSVEGGMTDQKHTAAVAAHAEAMRLARIRAIVNDWHAPSDIRNTFELILKDEEFHERAFREIAGEAVMNDTAGAHEEGLRVLGLAA